MKPYIIATRLDLIAGFLALLLVGIGALGLWGNARSNAALQTVAEDRAVPMGHLRVVQHQLWRSRHAIAISVLGPTAANIAQTMAQLDSSLAIVEQNWAAYMRTYLTWEETAITAEFAHDRAKFLARGLLPARAALSAGDIGGAHRLILKNISPLSALLENGVEALIGIQAREAKNEYDAAVARYDSDQLWAIGAITAGLALAAFSGYTLVQSLSGSLNQATAVAHSVAQRDLPGTTEVWRHLLLIGKSRHVTHQRRYVPCNPVRQ